MFNVEVAPGPNIVSWTDEKTGDLRTIYQQDARLIAAPGPFGAVAFKINLPDANAALPAGSYIAGMSAWRSDGKKAQFAPKLSDLVPAKKAVA